MTFRRIIPLSVKTALKRIYYFGNSCICNVCHSRLRYFRPAGLAHEVIDELMIIGGGLYEHDICPVCLSSYRQRSLMLYLQKNKLIRNYASVLHIAPEVGLYRALKKNISGQYVCGDFDPQLYAEIDSMVKIDVTKIAFPDNYFEFILCNHVLEHIPADLTAMKDIYRVLAIGGTAILQVPISLLLSETREGNGFENEEQRISLFGQKDHVRVYAMDYVNRLKSVGFLVSMVPVNSLIDSGNDGKMHLDEREILFVCSKNQ
ncbi:class I SAM-dependent methyltransferase [Breznakibacter xylanolyticus]|nr:class I SAM-dependent methyltransferase [Breznakibacter xylanolyticus]